MDRYSKITGKNPREILLLKSRPCKWGRCFFCDYIDDNGKDDKSIIKKNKQVLENVTGEFKQLEVINSASVFELPKESLIDIKDTIDRKNIETLYFESHYSYRHRLNEIRGFFPNTKIIFKCGIETFDDGFRNDYLKKGVYFKNPEEVAKYFSSICIMVGIKGQTKSMIRRDIKIIEKHFPHACINIYVENSTPVKKDEDLISWFKKEFSYLDERKNIEILWHNTDYGVGD